MASSSGTATPSRRQSLANRGRDADMDLSQSLNGLSLRTSSPARTPRASSRGPFNSSSSRSPSVASNRGAPRSPLNGPTSLNGNSRSGTPALLRKASLNSLRTSNHAAQPRRASSANLMSPSARSPLGGDLYEEPPPPPPPTASSIASAHFKAELDAHHGENATTPANTVVIIQDNCYGHRFSRPRTSKAALSTIVERPERLRASVLGVSAAYVRLGERHAEGAHPIHPKRDAAALPSVPFRIHKTARRLSLMSQTVTNVHGTKWMEELKLMCETAEAKLAMNGKELQRPEMNRGSGQDTPEKLHEGDLYLCSESLNALEGALGGLCEAVDTVFQPDGPKRAFVAIRPPGHHCSASYPSGFCWVNNVHVGIMHAILGHGLTHAAIIDFDLHHGDGSQAIAWQHNSRGVYSAKNAAWWKKTSIGYFSLHDINSYPCEMGDEEKTKNASICIDNAHGQTIWNVHLEPYKTEAEFWKIYESKYTILLDKTRQFLKQQTERFRAANQNCKAAIFISAGFDASEWESAGMQRHNVAVPTEFYAKITRDIVKIAEEEGTSVEGRVISALEGGYSDRALCSGTLSHISGLAGEEPMTKPEEFNGLGFEMGQRMGASHGRRESLALKNMGPPYDPSWWHSSELERLECAMASPPAEPKISRHMTPPTYSSPTQSSVAKIVSSPKLRRSVSNMSTGPGSPVARPPSPPPPEVPWTIAAHELSKLLIPSNCSTMSCTHEDLAAEATRARRDRQSVLAQSAPQNTPSAPMPAGTGPTRMSMRERKQVKLYGSIEEEESKNRRKTVAGSTIAQERAASRTGTPVAASKTKQHSRRLSAASTIVARSPSLEPPLPSARPMTSQGVRPDSSSNARSGVAGPLAMKKTRTAAAPKRETPRTSRTTKKIPAPAEFAKAQDSTQRPSTQTSTASGASQGSDDMDSLTSGMKKIRINVITPAQREARERAKREKAEQDAAAAAQRESQPPAVKVEEAFQPMDEPTRSPDLPSFAMSSPQFAAQPSISASSEPVTPHTESPPPVPSLEPRDVPLPMSSPVLQTPPDQPSTPNVFISYQPEGPTPEAVAQSQPLQWLPPNTAATPSPMKRTDLPVFTATSAIPFANRTNDGGHPVLPKPEGRLGGGDPRRDQSIWEVPETPQK